MSQFEQDRPSGAKARPHFATVAARVNSCPFTTRCFSAAREVVPIHDGFKLTRYGGGAPWKLRKENCVNGEGNAHCDMLAVS